MRNGTNKRTDRSAAAPADTVTFIHTVTRRLGGSGGGAAGSGSGAEISEGWRANCLGDWSWCTSTTTRHEGQRRRRRNLVIHTFRKFSAH